MQISCSTKISQEFDVSNIYQYKIEITLVFHKDRT